MTTDGLRRGFVDIFGQGGEIRFFFAPGRVNLIGEHIDYSGGCVFPCAINLGTYLAVRKREDKKLFGFSQNFKDRGIIEVDLDDTTFRSDRGWMNYVVGVFDTLKKMGYGLIHGFDFYIEGDLPKGAGLSSSASIEVVTAYAINQSFCLNLSKTEIAKLCQASENQYNGVKCGIMDQFAVAMGKKDNAILLDCNSLEYKYVPFDLGDKSLVIINSNKKRALADSKYNERRESCERALDLLKDYKNISNLCDLKEEEYEDLKEFLVDPEIRKRAKHAVMENQRVQKAAAALTGNDLAQFSKLMKESHISLRDDYEVSVKHLDKLAQLSWDFEGAWGSRMTGAGFGGCTVNIVENIKIDKFIRYVSEEYFKATGLKADFYLASISEGVHEIKG